jgi:hypothetical protein
MARIEPRIRKLQINIDSKPPTLCASVSPNTLWPPNGKKARVQLTGRYQDFLSGVDRLEFQVLDSQGQWQPAIQSVLIGGKSSGNWSANVDLIASREGGNLAGRKYAIKISAYDTAGNVVLNIVEVDVPHDQRK